jgi:hypothetical protein
MFTGNSYTGLAKVLDAVKAAMESSPIIVVLAAVFVVPGVNAPVAVQTHKRATVAAMVEIAFSRTVET